MWPEHKRRVDEDDGASVRVLPPEISFRWLADRLSIAYYGVLLLCFAATVYFAGIFLSMIRFTFFFHDGQLREWNTAILWYSPRMLAAIHENYQPYQPYP